MTRLQLVLLLLLLFISSISSQQQCQTSCPVGFYGCSCSNQCSNTCGTKTLGVLTYYDCDRTTGNCNSCQLPNLNPNFPYYSYGPQCTRCLNVDLAFLDRDPYTGHPFYPPYLSGAWVSPLYCDMQYSASTCGNSPEQLTVCRCLDPTKTFVLPTPIRSKLYTNLPGIPTGTYVQTWQLDQVAPPDPSTYCCIVPCPKPQQSGCQCTRECEVGCIQCSTTGPLVCQKCAPNYYMVQGKCQACPSSCSICTSPGCNTTNACQDNTGYCTNPCSTGYYGLKCDQACNCVPGSTCLTNGTCACDQAGTIVSQALFACVKPTCGSDRVNLCSGHGLCVQSQTNPTLFDEFCVCNNGYTGVLCNQPNTKADECDCGVLWGNPIQTSLGSLPGSIVLLSDMAGVKLFGDQSVRAGFPVGHPDEAKGKVYLDGLADGFLMWTSPFYGLQTGQSSLFPSPVLMAAPFRYQTGASIPTALPTGITFVMYTIDRSQQNNCTSLDLDLNYFWANNPTNRALVQQYCQDTHSDNVLVHLGRATDRACDTYPSPNLAFTGFEQGGFISNYWAIRYWRYMAHQHRLKPNAQCELDPVVFEPTSFCKNPRCLSLSGVGPPCMSNGLRTGYCLPNNNGAYQCKCLEFYDPANTGLVSLNYKPAWMGLACQFAVATFCINGNDKILCSGADNACQPKSLWNGQFYLQNFQQFQTPLLQDFLPRCNCDNSAFTGQFCEISRCPNNCKSLALNAGNCVVQNGQYVCQCTDLAVGTQCEISATPCLDSRGVKCSGRGICSAPDSNHTTPYCNCFQGFFGTICENFYCSPDQMTPGHGTCSNNIATGCYPPYSGSACSVDNCARYGGIVIGQPPSGCQCTPPYKNLYNGAVVPTCWPQCPTDVNGTVCGSVAGAGLCTQIQQTDSFRSAVCSCSQGFLLNQTTGLCDKYCINGDVGPGWTQQNPTSCVCSASTGFDIQNGFSPRCDHPICNGFGDYINGKCQCVQPYLSASKCSTHGCSRHGGVVIPWYMGNSQYRCSCPFPYNPLNVTQPYDCDGDLCGLNGVLNPVYGVSTNILSSACLCKGKYRTICANSTACDYCTGSFCLNGGRPSSTDATICACVYPFNGESCEKTSCNSTNTLSIDQVSGKCVCKMGFTGVLCDQSICQNSAQFVDDLCVCLIGYSGARCEYLAIVQNITQIIEEEITTITKGFLGLTPQQSSILIYTGAGIAFAGIAYYLFVQSKLTTTAAAAAVGGNAQETRSLIDFRRRT